MRGGSIGPLIRLTFRSDKIDTQKIIIYNILFREKNNRFIEKS
jgi:hypothetical protein